MREYTPQLRISANDPLCSATSLEGTVIGILFEKEGSEIKKAIDARLGLITSKIDQYKAMTEKIEAFVEKKRVVLKDIDKFYQDSQDEKRALLRPYQRKIDDIIKQCSDTVFKHDKDAYSKLGEKALVFEEGFNEASPLFTEIDELFKREEGVIYSIQGIPLYGVTGCQGPTGSTGAQGSTGKSDEFYSPSLSTDFLEKPARDMKDNAEDELEDALETDDESRAVEKMGTLRNLLHKYTDKLETLKRAIAGLTDEMRRLQLIRRNVMDTRSYKLDLNKLSAFGFEDINTTEAAPCNV